MTFRTRRIPETRLSPRDGYVIFAVLIVIVVLSLVAYRFTDTMTAEYRAGVRSTDNAQARLAAISGLHYSAALLAHRQVFYGDLNGYPYHNPAYFEWYEIPAPDGRRPAAFSIRGVTLDDDGNTALRYGVVDESGKLNINAMFSLSTERRDRQGNIVVPEGKYLFDALMLLPNMTEAIANAIIDWIDPNDDPRDGNGAESDYYMSLPNPYRAKNGPLNSLDELLLVRGVTPELLYGGDRNRNGIQDAGESDDTRGWSDYLTVYGRELNTDMWGNTRIYLNGEDLATIAQQLTTAGIERTLAYYIIAFKVLGDRITYYDDMGNPVRGYGVSGKGGSSNRPTAPATVDDLIAAIEAKNAQTGNSTGQRIRSLTDLINTRITLPRLPNTPEDAPTLVMDCPLLDPEYMATWFPYLMDKTTTTSAVERVPRINVNTAPREVLTGIPNMEPALVEAIIASRGDQNPASEAYVTGAWLLTEGIMTPSQFRRYERYLTGSTMVYRVQSVGFLPSGGPVVRMEAVIDIGAADPANGSIGAPRFLYVRDLSDLDSPRGFDPARENGR